MRRTSIPASNSAWSLDNASTFTSTSVGDGIGSVLRVKLEHTIAFTLIDEFLEFRVVHDRQTATKDDGCSRATPKSFINID
jgi:hypothetical protein